MSALLLCGMLLLGFLQGCSTSLPASGTSSAGTFLAQTPSQLQPQGVEEEGALCPSCALAHLRTLQQGQGGAQQRGEEAEETHTDRKGKREGGRDRWREREREGEWGREEETERQ